MIELITGLPGNAKTLYTIGYVKKWAERDSRPVFYAGINQLSLDWALIDPIKWMECPKGAIVVIDECQTIFRNRSINSQVPDYVAKLETHRHLGIDLVFITQHPMLIDPAIRRLTQTHKHLVRIWGMAASTIHRWDGVRDNCDKVAARKESEKTKWVFDKSLYSVYKSAELHTGKTKLPKALIWVLLVPLAIAAAFYGVGRLLVHKSNTDLSVHSASGVVPSAKSDKYIDPVADAKDYVYRSTPRLTNLAYTAPKYDEITKPTSAPVPAACVQSSNSCQCYTQQGTKLNVGVVLCTEIVAHGYFQEFKPDKQDAFREPDMRVGQNQLAQNNVVVSSPSRVAPIGRDGFGVLGKAPPGVRVPSSDQAPTIDIQADGSSVLPARRIP